MGNGINQAIGSEKKCNPVYKNLNKVRTFNKLGNWGICPRGNHSNPSLHTLYTGKLAAGEVVVVVMVMVVLLLLLVVVVVIRDG